MSKIQICPFRTYTESRPPALRGDSTITITGFMDCLKDSCPAFYRTEEYLPNTGGRTEIKECCRRLEK